MDQVKPSFSSFAGIVFKHQRVHLKVEGDLSSRLKERISKSSSGAELKVEGGNLKKIEGELSSRLKKRKS